MNKVRRFERAIVLLIICVFLTFLAIWSGPGELLFEPMSTRQLLFCIGYRRKTFNNHKPCSRYLSPKSYSLTTSSVISSSQPRVPQSAEKYGRTKSTDTPTAPRRPSHARWPRPFQITRYQPSHRRVAGRRRRMTTWPRATTRSRRPRRRSSRRRAVPARAGLGRRVRPARPGRWRPPCCRGSLPSAIPRLIARRRPTPGSWPGRGPLPPGEASPPSSRGCV